MEKSSSFKTQFSDNSCLIKNHLALTIVQSKLYSMSYFLEFIFIFRTLMLFWETNVGSECVVFLCLALFGLLILFSRLAGVRYLP